MAEVAHTALDQRAEQLAVPNWSPAAVIETALADVQLRKAGWTVADLTRAISDALPDHLGNLDDGDIARVLDTLTEAALDHVAELSAQRPGTELLPDELKLANGASAYEAPGGRLYATPEHVHTERILSAAAGESGAVALSAAAAQRFVDELAESGIELGADQVAAVRGVLTSGARIESLIGPAGTGKSFVVGAMAKAWQDPALWAGTERRVFGLASSQIATDVLAGEGLQASNITRWLDTQTRLGEARGGGDDGAWRLRPGDLVVVDESSMANTADLAAVQSHVDAAGAKLLLVGVHRQLAAVGAGGGMDLIARAGASYELAEARRFAHEWERDASLRLRDGDQSVLGEYHKQGRLVDAGTREQAEASAAGAWLADTLAGRHSLLIVDTNEQADRLCATLRAELVRLGRVDEAGVPLGLQGTYAGIGDMVQARLNGWSLAGYQGNRRGPINRENYRVLGTRDDGGLIVARIDGRTEDSEQLGEPITLPGNYVSRNVALGYAGTVHSSEGLTVDTSHPVVSLATGPEALYVEMSRGRYANTAHVVTTTAPDDPARGGEADARHRSPAAVLGSVLERVDPSRSALAAAAESEQENSSVRTPAEMLADAIELATAGRTARWLDALVDDGLLTERQRATLAAEDGAASLSRVLRRAELAGRDPEQV
ncbi:MAG: AAA family ATPase, partial [Actinomycetota bacterium]|nr:AAA family ATPase [Actinomycetota bacterium]